MERTKLVIVRNILVFTLLFGSLLSLVAWRGSFKEIPPAQSTYTWPMNLPSIATAGFPIRAIEIPQSPMGDDHVPASMFRGVVLNYVFWFVVGSIIAALFVFLKREKAQKKWQQALIVGAFLLLCNRVLFMIWFD